MRYYKLNENELQKELETDFKTGLSDIQVKERFKECGYNTTYTKPVLSFKSTNVIFLVLCSIVTLIYLIAGVFNLKNGFDYFFLAIASAVIFLLSQFFICVFDFLIDRNMYFSSLEKTDTLNVLRNGEKIRVKYSEIVYGDVVYLDKGDYIPFDGVIISSNSLVTDESRLAGDARSSKRAGIITDDNIKITGLFNSVFCGSFVIHGKATVVVTDVCSRVYVIKSGKNNKNKSKRSFKDVDVSTVFIAVFAVLCGLFSVVSGIVSRQYVGIITSVVFLAAFALSGFVKIFAKHSFKKSFLNLKRENVFIKSFDEIETISNADIMLLEHDMLFDDKVDISGFLTESMEIKSIGDIGKNNFRTFLYAALCLDSSSPVFKSCCRALKKIGIDYDEISSMCPLLSKTIKNNNGVRICARAYDGDNLLIAVGAYEHLNNICSNSFESEKVLQLYSDSTETFGVAIKKVDVVSDDLSLNLNDFSFVGVIGINRKLSGEIGNKVTELNKLGVHTVVLFPGNKQAAKNTFGNNKRIISSSDFIKSNSHDILAMDIICDYSGDKTEIVTHISSEGLLPGYFGDKILRDKKCISFKSNLMSRYETKDADVICSATFSSVYSAFSEAIKSTFLVRNAFENILLCLSFYALCGILFSILFEKLLLSTMAVALLLVLIVPSLLYFRLYAGVSDKEIIFYGNGGQLLSKKNIAFCSFTVLSFLILSALTRLFVSSTTAASFLILSFVMYLFFSAFDIKKAPLRCALGVVAPLVITVLFSLPFSFVFGNVSSGVILTLIAVIVGALLKVLISVLCRLVKN